MRLIRGLHHLEPLRDGCVLTIGNFDGLHLGHRRVIERVAAHGQRLRLPTVAMVFEPQPLEYFLGDHAPTRLTRLREKVIQFAKLPIDELLVLPFNRMLADYDAEQFIRDILVDRLNIKHLVIGDDFHFGKARRGNFALLQHRGEEYGFAVEATDSFELDGLRISSTLIRDALGEGDLAQAKILLGRDYSVCGRVAHGDKRGRELGFPTANLQMFRKNTPLVGVFAVTMTGLDGGELYGVANLGNRPTVDGGATAVLETHLFNFSQDIYGRYVEVHFKARLRDEVRFDSLPALQAQIARDVSAAQAFFAGPCHE
ncbi:bifunctional riboflavin kinase/FAD synthetase [Methylomonas rivi]|uniref:Riboflavin biosynthesis protein n=1 Tax=Methylomonas rivi TaxID=2952226 RepID=A0ABT1U0Y7_9GAMM|nr:bifunctional riboflavin kinase/FAD synthetase [Methylomonas sp. WSC-6]MBS4051809.1 bifunctional riboflavin kinase/FAD synthetase [Methylomonas sp.]MCQ8127469.1 bifunctional riboflavin kinase/FAD synthetase [Methylomonas sp. WSC-6]